MTLKQQIVYNFIKAFIKKVGVAPNYEEIMEATGIKHKSVLHSYLIQLETQGKIIRHKARSRGIELGKNIIKDETKKLIHEIKEDLDALSTFLCIPDEDTKEQILTAYRITNTILQKLTNTKL